MSLSTATPTPTPVPYDLTVTVTDETGAPIADANIVFPESGDDAAVQANEQGQYNWSNLPGEAATLNVTAQGYFPNAVNQTIVRGANEVSVTMQRDPFGLLPSQACAAGEKLLYAEDFQDGSANDWPQIEFLVDDWSVGEYPDELGNYAALNTSPNPTGATLEGEYLFKNAAWRLRYAIVGNRWLGLNWLQSGDFQVEGQQVDNSLYQVVIRTDGSEIHRLALPVLNLVVDRGAAVKAPGWHFVEISTYQGQTQLWVDGVLSMDYTDPQPIPPGVISIDLFEPLIPDTASYFDNISVCELSAPFTSIAPIAP
ncbi:MAG: carboxypeptidase-like regulatory domain-containing protein [Anaerolineales bacterium]|nr:carboxypeptidase-like regulatory domain-containing protein [Anaerolineales bacterium]